MLMVHSNFNSIAIGYCLVMGEMSIATIPLSETLAGSNKIND
jgi:hypothetical protein